MDKPQNEEKQYLLSNLTVKSIGLVRRGANKSPFFFVKSESGQQGDEMEEQENTIEIAQDELERFRAWEAGQADPPVETVDFAEKLAQQRAEIEEKFTLRLEREQVKTKELTEAFAAEQKMRRLREFTDTAATYSLPVSGVEQFGEDLMAIKDGVPEEVYERLTKTLRASDEAIKQGSLFSQFSQPAKADEGDPFLAKVEPIKAKILEENPSKSGEEAFTDAMIIAEERHPDLAARFALGGV